jgi:transketolase
MAVNNSEAEIVSQTEVLELSKNKSELEEKLKQMEGIALRSRKWIVKMTHAAGSGHPGGSLSATDILTALYFHTMSHDPVKPEWPDRDRFVLSKGHGAPALYATLAQAGYFPEEELLTLRKFGSRLQGHPSMRRLPGIDMSTGSLGQGLSVANGMALGGRLDKRDYRVYCLVGDGEAQEGQIWEAAMGAAHYKLDHVTAILDRNSFQIDGETEEIMGLEPLAEKWRAFGWQVYEIDGHDLKQIVTALDEAGKVEGRPQMIIAKTVKGKGISFMECNACAFHGNAPKDDELKLALEELGGEP